MQSDEIKTKLLNQISHLHQEKRLTMIVNDRIDFMEVEKDKKEELFALPQLIFYDKNRFVIEELRH